MALAGFSFSPKDVRLTLASPNPISRSTSIPIGNCLAFVNLEGSFALEILDASPHARNMFHEI